MTDDVTQKRGRDRLTIMAEVLQIAIDGALKSQIMYRANLSFSALTQYLKLLQELKLLDFEPSGNYKTTQKGLRYLQSYRSVRAIIDREQMSQVQSTKLPETEGKLTKKTQPDSARLSALLERMENNLNQLAMRVSKIEQGNQMSNSCPACGRATMPDFRYCPYCGEGLGVVRERTTKVSEE